MKFLPHVHLPQVSSEEPGSHANKANDAHTMAEARSAGSSEEPSQRHVVSVRGALKGQGWETPTAADRLPTSLHQ